MVMGMRLAAVDQLPVIKLTAAQTDATGACPICLHVRRRRRSTINTPPSSMNKCTIRDASFTVYSELFCFSFFFPHFVVGFQGRRDCQEIAGVLPHLPFGVHRQLVAVACPMPNVPSSCQLNAGVHSTYVDLQK